MDRPNGPAPMMNASVSNTNRSLLRQGHTIALVCLRSSGLSQNMQRVTELRDEGPHVAMVEVVVVRPLAELREEDADAAEAGHAVGPTGALPVLGEPPQVTVQPAGSHASPVRIDRLIILVCRPAPGQQRQVNAGLDGVLDGPREPRVDLHQQCAADGIATELHLTRSLQPNGLD